MSEPAGTTRRNLLRGGALGAGALVGAVALTGGATAAEAVRRGGVSYYLRMTGIRGAVVQAHHMGSIEVLGFSWGGEQETDGSLTATTLGLTMPASSASALIAEALVSKQAIQTAKLSSFAPNKFGVEENFLTMTFSNVGILQFRQTIGGHSTLYDHVKIAFHSVDFASKDGTDYTWTLPIDVP